MERSSFFGKNNLPFEKIIIPYHGRENDNFVVRFLELRRDPLTLLWNKINPFKKKEFYLEKEKYKRSFAMDISCPFCKGNEKMIQDSVVNSERVFYSMGNSILFLAKNLYSEFHALLIPDTANHTPFIDEIKYYDFHIALDLARSFFKRNINKDPNAKYVYISLNHTSLAGASIDHLHFHLEQTSIPTNYHRILLERVKEHFERNRSSLLEDYASSEKEFDERFIHEG